MVLLRQDTLDEATPIGGSLCLRGARQKLRQGIVPFGVAGPEIVVLREDCVRWERSRLPSCLSAGLARDPLWFAPSCHLGMMIANMCSAELLRRSPGP